MLEKTEKLLPIRNLAILALLVTAGFQTYMVLRFEANWDEFYLLDWLYLFHRDELSQVLYTIYLHLFFWLPSVSVNELDQIVVARAVMYGFAVITCLAIYLTSRRFFSVETSLLVVLLFLSFTSVFRHLTSFRVDTMSLALLMSATFLVTGKQNTLLRSLFCGFLIGLAGMITIKSFFFAIMIGLILLINLIASGFQRDKFIHAIGIGFSSILFFLVLYAMHASQLPSDETNVSYVSSVVVFSLLDAGFFPEWKTFTILLSSNPLYFALLFLGFLLAVFQLWQGDRSATYASVTTLAFLIPLSTLLFYRHAHPYFYVHMLAPASILTGHFFEFLREKRLGLALVGTFGVICFAIVKVFLFSTHQTLDYQRRVVDVIHEMYPRPVDYIDRAAMISSFRKRGIFMSRWGMLEYYTAGKPIMGALLETYQPQFLLANIDSLDLDKLDDQVSDRPLLPADQTILEENFIHHWGPIYVPGKKLSKTAADEKQNINIIVSGHYTVEAVYNILVNGVLVNPGDSIELESGSYTVDLTNNSVITLRWGKGLYKPEDDPPDHALFRGF